MGLGAETAWGYDLVLRAIPAGVYFYGYGPTYAQDFTTLFQVSGRVQPVFT